MYYKFTDDYKELKHLEILPISKSGISNNVDW